MTMKPSRRPPMLPTKRARLQALQADVRAILVTRRPGQGLKARSVDTSSIDAGWPDTWTSPVEMLAADARRRGTGRAVRPQAALRAAVVRWMDVRLGVREVRIGDVVFKLGQDRLVPTGDGFELRSGLLRVTLDVPKPQRPVRMPASKPVNLARVGEALRAALTGGTSTPDHDPMAVLFRTPKSGAAIDPSTLN